MLKWQELITHFKYVGTVYNVYNFNINIKEIKYKKIIDIIKENKYTFSDIDIQYYEMIQ